MNGDVNALKNLIEKNVCLTFRIVRYPKFSYSKKPRQDMHNVSEKSRGKVED